MSPKGGIKPHKRFTVQASRSEVLFVDYMAEHLTATGRAAIVVPEGIIFQSGTAYKTLRKMLVDTSLVAVVSLPAGVFNPYSGVKTSILILDKRVHKQTDKVLFVKVQNDGFNLGAQRRAVVNSDLPEATRLLRSWMTAPQAFEGDGAMAQAVERGRIGASGDFNLSAERHLIATVTHHNWQIATLGELCTKITDGSHNPPEKQVIGELMLSSQNIFDNELNLNSPRLITPEDFQRENKRTEVSSGDVLLTIVGTIGRCLTVNERMPKFALQRSVAVLKPKQQELASDYLCRILQSEQIQAVLAATAKGVAQKGVYLNDLRSLKIPIPPLEIQHQIVAEIEGYQKIIDGARQVLENYKPHIVVGADWPTVKLGDICDNQDSKRAPVTKGDRVAGQYPYYGASGIVDYVEDYLFDEDLLLISEDGANLLARSTPIAFSVTGKVWVNNHAHVLRFPDRATQKYVELFVNSIDISGYVTGSAQPKLNQAALSSIKIPLPDLATQRAIVAEIEAEQALVAANRELIRRMEAKVKAAIDRVWGV
jgi:type I restriction enzyme M protein